MDASFKISIILVALYLGGVTGFFCGYLANASILRGYREQAEELRHQLELGYLDVKGLGPPIDTRDFRGR